jgi:hypothetical protein
MKTDDDIINCIRVNLNEGHYLKVYSLSELEKGTLYQRR